MNHDIEEFLSKHRIRPTAVRMLVWQEVCRQTETFSLNDMERWMPDMDRSSIFRALRLFTEHKLLHIIDDGLGIQKYCVCRCDDDHSDHHINHIHFTCLQCGKTYCLEDYMIPMVDLPSGFLMKEAEYVIKGVCRNCTQ